MAIPFKYLLLQAFACKLYFKVNLHLFKLFFGQLLLFIERKPLSTLPHNFSEKAKFTLKFISELLSDFLISKNFGRGSKRKIEFWIITFSLSKQPCICFSHFVDVLLTYLISPKDNDESIFLRAERLFFLWIFRFASISIDQGRQLVRIFWSILWGIGEFKWRVFNKF